VRGFSHCVSFHRGDARGDTDNDSWPSQVTARMRFSNELAEHDLGPFEICDHTIFHGPDNFNVPRCAPYHHLGLFTHSKDPPITPAIPSHGYDGGFIYREALALDVDKGISCTEIHGEIIRKPPLNESRKHKKYLSYR